MPPKKDTAGGDSTDLITGFSDKECKLLAAAFISSTASDKYDYDLMASLTKNTAGSLKKMWPPVKKKAMETHSSFAAFLGQSGTTANGEIKSAPAPKANNNKKRKVTSEAPDDADNGGKKELELTSAGNTSDGSKSSTKKKAPAAKGKGRARKQVKKELSTELVSEGEVETYTTAKSETKSVDGEDSLGEFAP
ncbi:hypothetical protein BKA66DRAFT_48633 [Pyrenochaeta sp. MPI-SDFR-AT-0127]|nr:hypothetical protein BKA66DRAFT_48633 [Pyrenochaeta sp. MPI-SDFR-AT-0127]